MNLNFLKNPYVLGGGLAGLGGADALMNSDEHTPVGDVALGTGLGVLAGRIPALKNRLQGQFDKVGRSGFEKNQGIRRSNVNEALKDLRGINVLGNAAGRTERNALDAIAAADARQMEIKKLLGDMKDPEFAAYEEVNNILKGQKNRFKRSKVPDRYKGVNFKDQDSIEKALEARIAELTGKRNSLLDESSMLGKSRVQNERYAQDSGARKAEKLAEAKAKQALINGILANSRQAVAKRAARNQALATSSLALAGGLGGLGASYLNPYGEAA